MAGRRPEVHWNEPLQRWVAWVRFPDGSRRKVERVDRDDAEQDLGNLLALRAEARSPGPRRERLMSFGELFDAWVAAGCPKAAPSSRNRHMKKRSTNTIENILYSIEGHLRPAIGNLKVDRTTTQRLEQVFAGMADGYATSTIDHAWGYLNQACLYGIRLGKTKRNPAADVLLPEAKPPKKRKSLSIEQIERLMVDAIPQDLRPAMWLTGLMCGLRPGELAGLRWIHVDIDSDEPSLDVAERASELKKKYVGQAEPKTDRKGRIGLHPLVVAGLRRHRAEMHLLGRYDGNNLGGPFEPVGFVFCTRNLTPLSLSNLRRDFQRLCERAGLVGEEWTTYELRHTFGSLVSDQLDDVTKVADLMGHANTRSTEGYRHPVRPSLPHAIEAWDRLLTEQEARKRKRGSTGHPESADQARLADLRAA